MTLATFRAKNHPQQVAKRGADDATDDRRTPDDFWQSLHERFGFSLDAAASAENAKLARFYDIAADGLRQPWHGAVWCNPPYSDVATWVEKAWSEMELGVDVVVMLVPANRTEQDWWQRLVEPFRVGGGGIVNGSAPDVRLRVEFLRGRMRFDRPGWTRPAKGDRPPFGLCLLIWERDA